MTKHIEKLKKQLAEIADAVNAFQSETVQLKIIARLSKTCGVGDIHKHGMVLSSHKNR